VTIPDPDDPVLLVMASHPREVEVEKVTLKRRIQEERSGRLLDVLPLELLLLLQKGRRWVSSRVREVRSLLTRLLTHQNICISIP
jgi:hypothetical protein